MSARRLWTIRALGAGSGRRNAHNGSDLGTIRLGVQLRERFWERLVYDPAPLGHLGVDDLEQLRTILQLAIAGS